MTPAEVHAQHAVILAAARRQWPRCQHLRVLQYEEDDRRWLVHDPESDLWWEAAPGGASRDPSGYSRPDTVAFWPVEWREVGRRTRGETLAAELDGHGLPASEMIEDEA